MQIGTLVEIIFAPFEQFCAYKGSKLCTLGCNDMHLEVCIPADLEASFWHPKECRENKGRTVQICTLRCNYIHHAPWGILEYLEASNLYPENEEENIGVNIMHFEVQYYNGPWLLGINLEAPHLHPKQCSQRRCKYALCGAIICTLKYTCIHWGIQFAPWRKKIKIMVQLHAPWQLRHPNCTLKGAGKIKVQICTLRYT